MVLFNSVKFSGLAGARKIVYCVTGLFALSTVCLYGCKTSVPQKTLSDAEVSAQASADAVKRARAKSSTPSGSGLFEKMDASLYHGDPDTYGDIVMDTFSTKNNMNPVVFSHSTHRNRYTCRVCHLELEFSMKKGESGVTRDDYLDGRYCGACHDGKLAFPVDNQADCNRCHISIDRRGQYTSKNITVDRVTDKSFGDGVDWMGLLRTGKISPQTSMSREENVSTMPLPPHLSDDNLRWTTKTPSYPVSVAVWFPHDSHVKWLDCANCHPDIFTVKQNGTVDFDKTHILDGKYCGACHLTVAFPMDGCRLCHPDNRKKK